MAKRISVKATIVEGEGRGKPTIRLYMNQAQKEKMLLMKGRQPKDLFTIIIL